MGNEYHIYWGYKNINTYMMYVKEIYHEYRKFLHP